MNELIQVNMENETISARDLHEKLEISKRFSAWFEQFQEMFEENEDFKGAYLKVHSNQYGGEKDLPDYQISIDMAKHICMMSKSEKGKIFRQYFIDLEKAWNTPEQILSRALKLADKTIKELRLENSELKPKADFFDAVADSKTAVSMNDVAKTLDIKGIGRNKLFEILRDKGILMQNNQPYQKYVDAGYFRVIEQKYSKNGETHISFKTLVYQRGLDYIRKKLLNG